MANVPTPAEMLTRRACLGAGGISLASMALAHLGASTAQSATLTGLPHHPPRCKNVVYLQMLGGPSQFELFDHKPALVARHGRDVPPSFFEGERFAFLSGTKKFLGSRYAFAQHGQSGAWISELMPHLAQVADKLTFLKGVQSDQFNHGPAQIFLCTGSATPGRPSMGAWVNYGLGSEASNLPGYVVLVPAQRNAGGKTMWGSGFLPAKYQGVEFQMKGEPVPYVRNPEGLSTDARADTVQAINHLNRIRSQGIADPELAGSIAAYEMAFRMQSSVPDLMDLTGESRETLALYGADNPANPFARSCLLARRLVERGVRFVQICYEGEPGIAIWDLHGDTRRASLEVGLPILCQKTDQPTAGLIKDLEARGLLDETLIIWGGEFGRTPMNEDRPGAEKGYTGRDHWPKAGTMFFAGGGMKPGLSFGATDELGYRVVENPAHVHDINATILHLLGIDHERLVYRFQGRDFRLTDVHGRVLHEIIAS